MRKVTQFIASPDSGAVSITAGITNLQALVSLLIILFLTAVSAALIWRVIRRADLSRTATAVACVLIALVPLGIATQLGVGETVSTLLGIFQD